MKSVLSAEGYGVECFSISSDALEALEASKPVPYTLIISNYMMPEMKGDEILKKAREIAPNTQRILIADAAELETLVNAVNLAGIHACLTLPFDDPDLLYQVDQCCRQYDMVQKQNHFKRVTQHQNRQLFEMASSLKKKDALNLAQLEQKKKEIRILESRIRSAGGSLYADKPLLLKDILTKRNIDFSPDAFGSQFLTIKNEIKQILEVVALSPDITLTPVSSRTLLDPSLLNPEVKELMDKILVLLFALLLKDKPPEPQSRGRIKEIIQDVFFEVRLSEDNSEAFLKIKTKDTHSLNPSHVRQFLEKNKIITGIKEDHEIESWLFRAIPGDEPFVVAKAREPKYPKNADICYYFPTRFLHAGKVNEDGSIDFKDRGEIPYIKDGALLATKIHPEPGAYGIDVFGKKIPVEEAVDLAFSSGIGTRLSEDGARIYAAASGQPHLDALGTVSVCAEFQIKGDLGFETGNVNFNGNVIIDGAVKRGFKVKCASLTAKEIHGAEVDISGDLNVSFGIVDAELIKVKGSIQAKYIHNSKINAFGDLIVQKEIIDSIIYLSGACINERGSILNSKISAKMGIRAGNIGSPNSKPSTLTVGVDNHTRLLTERIDSLLMTDDNEILGLKTEVEKLEKEDQDLHGLISKYAYIQDRAQLDLKDLEKKLSELKASRDMAAYQKIANTIKEIRINAKKAEEKINKGFDRQDQIVSEISRKSSRIKEFEAHSQILSDEKKLLIEFSGRTEALAEVKIGRKAESETRIFSPNTSLTLSNSALRCRIKEVEKNLNGMLFYEMQISNF